jgi:hypothetical protein
MTQAAFIEQAQQVIMNPEIKEIAQKLHEYGLGICLPHFHNEDGGFLPLPSGMMSMEEELMVSFQPIEQVKDAQSVAWRWDDNSQNLVVCAACSDGRFHIQ